VLRKYFWNIILLSIFVFFITCSKKIEKNKIIENVEVEKITNETKNNLFEYKYISIYNDIEDLLIKNNEKEVDSIYDKPFYFGRRLEYLSYIKININITEAETWFSSWYQDHWGIENNLLFLHIIKDNNILKTYKLPVSHEFESSARCWSSEEFNKYEDNDFRDLNFIRFPILDNLPGKFYPYPNNDIPVEIPGTYLFDVNEDGFDEIICVTDFVSADSLSVLFQIVGFDKEKDGFVSYLNIITNTIDENTGPEPILYIKNQGIWGFRCLIDISYNYYKAYKPIYGIPLKENKYFEWVFFTWNSNEKKYIEKIYIE
jgi:hypothetical protein